MSKIKSGTSLIVPAVKELIALTPTPSPKSVNVSAKGWQLLA
jgi:hypothetical protein